MKVYDIEWDIDEEETADLPAEMNIPEEVIEEAVSDFITDETGFCHKGFRIESNEVVEVCPHCEVEVVMQWNVEKDGYKAFCPYCGKRLMLCGECLHHGEEGAGNCDYCSQTDSCKHNPSKSEGIVGRLTKRNEFGGIDRVCQYDRYNQNWGCLGCSRRTECNADIYERLAEYEDTGYTPEEIMEKVKR